MKQRFIVLALLLAGMISHFQSSAQIGGCIPQSGGKAFYVANVMVRQQFGTPIYENPTSATPYSNYSGTCVPYNFGLPGLAFSVFANQSGFFYSVWVDANDNNVFETGELVANGGPTASNGINFSMPNTIPFSNHLVRVIVSGAAITGPCANLVNGETEDYCLNFGCVPVSNGNGTFIANVRIRDTQTTYFSNPTGADGYTDYTNPCHEYLQGTPNLVFSITANVTAFSYAIWVDENDNGIFEPGELQGSATVLGGNGTINQGLGGIAPGPHRVRVIISDAPITDPCGIMQNGETEDYCLNFGCVPSSNGNGTFISEVRIRDMQTTFFSNPTGANGYTDYTNPCHDYVQGQPGLVFSITANAIPFSFAIWIDENDNGIFEPGELANSGTVTTGNGTINASFSGINPGSHRVRVIVSSTPTTDPCAIMQNGEAEDYCLNFGCVPNTLNQNAWISRVYIGTGLNALSFDNPTGPSPYSDFTDHCAFFDNTLSGNNFGIQGSQTGMYYAVYIDFNQDGIFDPSELYNFGGPLSSTGVNMNMPTNLNGQHNVRVIMSTTPITGPCDLIVSGETEDYCLNFGCNPVSANQDVWISRVFVGTGPGTTTYDNPSGPSAYSDYTANCVFFDNALIGNSFSFTASQTGLFYAVYIDFNGDGTFDPSELYVGGGPLGSTGLNMNLPGNLQGEHRVRIIVSTAPITGPCDPIANGEIEDYRLCFPCRPTSTDQSAFICFVNANVFGTIYYNNPTGASAYSDYTANCINFNSLINMNLGVGVNMAGLYLAIYLDINDNGIFEAGELLNPGTATTPLTGTGINQTLPQLTGDHLLRIIVSRSPITGPCDDVAVGEIEDYRICYPCEPPRSSTQFAWISRVRLTSALGVLYDNPSGASSYSNFISPCIPVPVSQSQVNVNIATTTANRYVAVYIDYNGDGFFQSTEVAYNWLIPVANLAVPVVPASLASQSLMRIVYSSAPITGPCDKVMDGEVEDYLLCLDGGRGGKVSDQGNLHPSGIGSVSLSLYPQPAHDHVTLDFSISRDEQVSIDVRDIHGKLLMAPLASTAMQAGSHSLRLSTEQLSSGMYLVTLHTLSGSKTSKLVIE